MADDSLSRSEVDDRAETLAKTVVQAKKKIDRRLLVLYAVLVVGVVIFLTEQQRSDNRNRRFERAFEQQITANCYVVRDGNAKVNGVLDQLATNIHNSTTLTDEQKKVALENYAAFHLPIGKCPPVLAP